jgi:hypothetical protein
MITATKKQPRPKMVKIITPNSPEAADIVGRALLIRVRITQWSAHRTDDRVTNKALSDHDAQSGGGRFWKSLFGAKTPELAAVWAASQHIRAVLRTQTLPWSETDEGWRLLPTANYLPAVTAVRKAVAAFDEAADVLVARYDALKTIARTEKLGTMYRESDYPAKAEIRSRYSHSIEFTPIPIGSDFRVSLPDDALKAMQASVKARVQAAGQIAMQDAWSRLAEVVNLLAQRLDDDGKYLRDALVVRIKETAEALGRLNIVDDPALETMRTRVLDELTKTPAVVLKENETKRAEVGKKAHDILKAMSGLYGKKETK